MDNIVKFCQQPRLNLKNSPPFILDILPDTFQTLSTIIARDSNCLKENYYLQLFVENLHLKCKQVCFSINSSFKIDFIRFFEIFD